MKSGQRSSEIPKVGYEVLVYLSEHPDARDTLRGIVEWWLLERQIRNAENEIKGALKKLVDRRLILARDQVGDARTYYGINPDKSREIDALLRKKGKPQKIKK